MGAEPRSPESLELLPLLKRVSRAFYLSIRVLPSPIRRPVGLAYLLARIADTISDTGALPADRRLDSLIAFRHLLTAAATGAADAECAVESCDVSPSPLMGEGWGEGENPRLTGAERDLLEAAPAALDLLSRLPSDDRRLVSGIVARLSEGMEFDLTYFAASDSPAGAVEPLRTAADLNRYTYLVAGCVGEFWTRVAVAHTPALSRWDVDDMAALGVRFGKALQLTNVLRDAPRDLDAGRCYIPAEWLDELGLSPNDLLNPDSGAGARPALTRGIELALDHFVHAERYLLAIPRRCVRLRLAAAWPLILGLATLERVARNPRWLDVEARAAVSRPFVYRMIAVSLVVGASNAALSRWIRALTRRVRSALNQSSSSPN